MGQWYSVVGARVEQGRPCGLFGHNYLTPTRSASFSGHYLGTGSMHMSSISDVYSGQPCELQLDENAPLTIDSVKDKNLILQQIHRQLQENTGFSFEITAIVFTGLFGMVGYVVHARSGEVVGHTSKPRAGSGGA
jgi:hypothetical protein